MNKEQSSTQRQTLELEKQNPQIDKTMYFDNKFSIVDALRKLRRTQDNIYAAHHKLDILKHKHIKIQKSNVETERKRNKSLEVSDFIKEEKRKKNRYLDMKTIQQEQKYKKNQERKKLQKEKLQSFRQTFQEKNKTIYLKAKQEEKRHQKNIKQEKIQNLSQKQDRRQQLFQKQKLSSLYVQQYFRNKHISDIQRKKEEANLIQSKISERQQFLLNLEEKGSQASLYLSRSRLAGEKGQNKMRKIHQKGFNLNVRSKNQLQEN